MKIIFLIHIIKLYTKNIHKKDLQSNNINVRKRLILNSHLKIEVRIAACCYS